MSRRCLRGCLVALSFSATATRAWAQDVTWTSAVSVAVSGSSLQKTGGCPDAGAVSEQTIPAGDGDAEFTIAETTIFFVAGLSHGGSGIAIDDINSPSASSERGRQTYECLELRTLRWRGAGARRVVPSGDRGDVGHGDRSA